MKKNIFIVEKNRNLKKILKENIGRDDNIVLFETPEELMNKLSLHPDLIAVSYEDCSLNSIKQIIRYDSSLKIIVFSKNHEVEEAVEVVRAGVYAYLNYTDNAKKIKEVIDDIFKNKENCITDYLKEEPWYFGSNQSTKQLLDSLNKAVEDNLDVIILGEIGTGKESIARIIHDVKNKRKKTFAFINFSKYEQEYWEAHFWSSFRDYFNEYDTDVPNLKETIYGTIYLKNLESQDENFRTSLFQMLRQRREGKDDKFRGNIRVIIGLMDPKSLDKINRENFHIIRVPSLRERKEEIIDLTRILLKRFAAKYNRRVEAISLNVLDFLTSYSWPGNIAELESLIRSAVLKSKKSRIDIEDLWLNIEMLNDWTLNSVIKYKNSMTQALAYYEGNLIKTFLKKFESYEVVSKILGIDEIELEKKVREITTF